MTFHRKTLENPDFVQVDFGRGKKLAQRKESFQEITKPNRRAFLDLMKSRNINSSLLGAKEEKDGLKAEVIGYVAGIYDPRIYYKLDYDDRSFFVKKLKKGSVAGGGAQEVLDMVEAEKFLSDLPKVRIAHYQVGYEDNYDTYSITDWDDSMSINLGVLLESQQIDKTKKAELSDRFTKIRERLSKLFFDVEERNVAYDINSDTVIVFDLIKKPDRNVD